MKTWMAFISDTIGVSTLGGLGRGIGTDGTENGGSLRDGVEDN